MRVFREGNKGQFPVNSHSFLYQFLQYNEWATLPSKGLVMLHPLVHLTGKCLRMQ